MRCGWRDALVVLVAILAVTTVPLHAVALRRAPPPAVRPDGSATVSIPARAALRSRPFWLLSVAFVLAMLTAIAMTVHAIPFLLERGHSAPFAAFAVGLVGVSQIPGRLLFSPLAERLTRPFATASPLALIAVGIAVLVSAPGTAGALAGLVLLGSSTPP